MDVKIIGAGAVGMTVAYRLKDNSDIAFIVDKERKNRYSRGLVYNGSVLDVELVEPPEAKRQADLIIVAVKNFQLDCAMSEMEPFVGENTTILPLLNGIDAERELSRKFGKEKVLYGFITDLSANHCGESTNCFSDGGTIVFGEYDNSITDRVRRISTLFEKCNQRYVVPDDILHEKWWKFMLNTCFNTLSATLVADYASISGNDYFIRCVRVVAKEVQAVALAEGVVLTIDDIESMVSRVQKLKDHGQTSMLQDLLAHRNTENSYFAGAISRLGKKHAIATPICDFIQILLEAKRYVYNAQ